jgi:hypothetical protein
MSAAENAHRENPFKFVEAGDEGRGATPVTMERSPGKARPTFCVRKPGSDARIPAETQSRVERMAPDYALSGLRAYDGPAKRNRPGSRMNMEPELAH